jgi:hypothetical protein
VATILVGSEEERSIEKGRVYFPALTGFELDSLKVTVDEINVRSAELKTGKWKISDKERRYLNSETPLSPLTRRFLVRS